MINGKTVLVVVPARGGSKGIPLKNLSMVAGKPLLQWVGEVIDNVPEIDRAVVSTDHEKIAEQAQAFAIDAPFRRPEALSGDCIGDWEVLNHALQFMEALDKQQYDVVVMLQPTSPTRQPAEVSETITKLVTESLDAVWTVSETDSKVHPMKQLNIGKGLLDHYQPEGAEIVARQQLMPTYHRNGVAYAMTRECILNQKTILGKKTGALILDRPYIFDIDHAMDIKLIEFFMRFEKEAMTA